MFSSFFTYGLLFSDASLSSDWLVSAAIALVALAAMEIVLGIDNIVFISIVTAKLPPEQQPKARIIGLGLAMGLRILLLVLIRFVMQLTTPAFELDSLLPFAASWLNAENHEEINVVSWRDLILIGGGLFLLGKSVHEIDQHVAGDNQAEVATRKPTSFVGAIFQILVLDIIFSLDSVITAVGMADDLEVMIAAVIIAVIVMMIFAGKIGRFVENNPTIKMLALSFLVMIGVMLLAEGGGTHFNKGYVYFAMAFSLVVELLNLRARRKREKRSLEQPTP